MLRRFAGPTLRRLRFQGVQPGPIAKVVLSGGYQAFFLAREGYEWAWRSLVATPTFLALCAEYGENITVDRVPYMSGHARIELGSDIRVSGLIGIVAGSRGNPVLRIGNGVYIGHGTSISVSSRVEIGNYCAIGADTYITDTDGHSHTKLDTPIWEDLADDSSVAPVVIEDNVQLAKGCTILKGVRIGARSIVGAGAVIRTNVPPDSIVAGNPGRVAGWRRPAAPGATQGVSAGEIAPGDAKP